MKPIGIKIIKICLGVLLSLVLLISASTAVVMYLFPEEKIREIVIREATQTLNRKVAIGGFSYGLRGIVLKDLSVYDGQTEKDPLLTRAGEVSLGFSLLDLLHKKLSIRRIYVKDLGLNVVFDKNNVPNLQRLIEEILRNRGRESSMSASIDMIKLSDARISIIEPRGYFKPLGGEYLISGNLDLSAKNALSIDDCTVRMPETRGIAHPVITIAAKDGEVSISGDVKLDRASLLWVYQWAGTPTPPQPYDVVTGDVTNLLIRITKERNVIVEGNARASSTLINSRHIVHAEGFCRVNVDRQSVFISDLKGRIDSSSFLMQRLLFYFNGVLDQFEVKNASADISHIRALLSAIPDRLYGFVRGDLMYDRKMFTGNLALKNAGFDYENKLVSGIDTDLVITGNRFRKTDIPLTVLGNRCSASVASTDDSMKNIFINVRGNTFVIDEAFFGKKSGSGSASPSTASPMAIPPVPVNITAQIDMGSVRYDKLNFGETHVNCTLAGRNITIQRFSTAFMQGEIFGDGNISFTESGPMASSSVTFNHLIVQDIASITENFKNRMYGFAYGSGQISAPLSGDILSSAKGNFEFRVDRGKIVNTGIQNGLGVWLSELKYKLTDLEFNTIYGNVTIDRDNYIINSFVFNSENIRLKIQGPLNRELETSKLDITLEFSSPFIQDVPTIAISLQNRKKGSWYIIPFIASGKITEGRNIRMR